MSPSVITKKKRPSGASRARSDEKWAQKILARMSLEEKLGQMLIVYYRGRFVSAADSAFCEIVRQVKENHAGGIMLEARRTPTGIERGQVYPSAALADELQRLARIPLLVAADFEAGTATRLEEGTSLPSAMALAATGDPRNAFTAGQLTAIEARAAGVNWIFAPVCDVNSNADNPIINTRSFGDDPAQVAKFAVQFICGIQENSAMATAKHFPGHGNVNVDSHIGLPCVPGELAELNRVELAPFRAAIAAGVGAVMSGHVSVASFESDCKTPATLSSRILTDLLRKGMGFDGIVVTDALDMGGVTRIDSAPNIAVRAIRAGADVLLIPPNPDAAIAALKQAIESGELPLARVNEAVLRILRAKAELQLQRKRANWKLISTGFSSPKFRAIAQEIADCGITLPRDEQKILPLDATKPLRILMVIVSGDADPYPGGAVENELCARVESVRTIRVDARFMRAESVKLPSPEDYDLAIAVVLVRVADRKGTVGLPTEEIVLLKQLISGDKPVILASLGSPYLAAEFPDAKTWIAAFGTQEVLQHAIIRAIFGQITICGELPVTVPGVAIRGAGLRVSASTMLLEQAPDSMEVQLAPAFAILDRAVSNDAFPGGVLAFGRDAKLLVHPFGRLSWATQSLAVKPDTIYDVASLTKPVVTTTAIMMLVAHKEMDLDAPVSLYLQHRGYGLNPEWFEKITIRQLLLHTSGLPAHRDYFRAAKSAADVWRQLFAERLVTQPGGKAEYSDLGFMLLGKIVERLAGRTLGQFAHEMIFAPLGMHSSSFNPPHALRARIAPTEGDIAYRKRELRGEVDDANAFAMGGVAGHAGLFSTAGDLAAFAQMMMNGGIYAHKRILPGSIVTEFTRRVSIGDSARALGWDVPTGDSSSGRYFSSQSYGHTGFTGTSIWVDPQRNAFVILLTNRVHPSASNNKIREIRPRVHNAIFEALLAGERARK